MAPESLKSELWSQCDSMMPSPTARLPMRGGHATYVHSLAAASDVPECESATARSRCPASGGIAQREIRIHGELSIRLDAGNHARLRRVQLVQDQPVPHLELLGEFTRVRGVGEGVVGRSLPAAHTIVSCSLDAELGSTISVESGP